MKIENKADMYKLYERGAFGNIVQQWKSIQDFIDSKFSGQCVLRYTVPGNNFTHYNLSPNRIVEQAAIHVLFDKADESKFKVNALMDDTKIVLQGEVWRSTEGLYLRYTTSAKPMRIALTEMEQHAHGLTAKFILQMAMTPNDYDDLMDLLDTYDDHVIEFSTWSVEIGDCPRRQTVIWEIRGTY